jgi:hypothetical protein
MVNLPIKMNLLLLYNEKPMNLTKEKNILRLMKIDLKQLQEIGMINNFK